MTTKTSESLTAYNEIIAVVDSMLRNEIQIIENQATDAKTQDWNWWEAHKKLEASDLELIRSRILVLTNQLFLDTLREIEFAQTAPQPTVQLVKRIELPNTTPVVTPEVVAD